MEDTTTWAQSSDVGEEDPGAAVEALGAALLPPTATDDEAASRAPPTGPS